MVLQNTAVLKLKGKVAVPMLVEYEAQLSGHSVVRRECCVVAGSEGGQDSENFLQEMFPTMDAEVVRDVLQHVHNDQEKACHQLLVIQVNARLTTPTGLPYCALAMFARKVTQLH